MEFSFDDLLSAVDEHAGMCRVMRLTPLSHPEAKVRPPCYPSDAKDSSGKELPPKHVFETRWIDNERRACCLLNSLHAELNGFEEALHRAVRRGRIQIPYLELEFTDPDLRSIGRHGLINSFETPHRTYDAAKESS